MWNKILNTEFAWLQVLLGIMGPLLLFLMMVIDTEIRRWYRKRKWFRNKKR